MTYRIVCLISVAALAGGAAFADEKNAATPAPAAAKAHRTADGHPDLSGIWTYAIDVAPVALKKTVNGKTEVINVDQSARHKPAENVPGALAWTKEPNYKPELKAKVADLDAHQTKTDNVFACGKPGVPRIGSPRRIIQLPNEMIFLYEDISGDPYRIIPTDGRPHRADANPSYYGDAVGHWEGDTLVIETTNFVEDTWFGEYGYFHSDAMRVIERLWRVGDNLAYQVTVDDPKVLVEPWTNFPHIIKPSTQALEESPVCREDDGNKLLNLDHHLQR
jgi:hypothetical protein